MNEKRICFNCFKELNTESDTCPLCGYSPSQDRDKYPLALPLGSVLNGQYVVGRVLGQGGFGITYIAQDWKSKNLVAIKEYLPDTMATRNGKTTVMAYSGSRGESFGYGKECFLQEAKTLAEFIGNPNIVNVHCYFEENGTGYFVMDYVQGRSLQSYLKSHSNKISWEEAVDFLVPIMRALNDVHSKGIIHRDVTPDNIFITGDGIVKLLDFGAARYSLGDRSRSLDVVLKHGFAPKEQYTRHGRQGPYTDIYSVGATFYFAITGRKPPDSIDRLEEDEIVLPSNLGIKLPEKIENAILKAMAVQPMDRFASMQEFIEALGVEEKQKKPAVVEKVQPITENVSKVYAEQQAVPPATPQAVQQAVPQVTPQEEPQEEPDTSEQDDNLPVEGEEKGKKISRTVMACAIAACAVIIVSVVGGVWLIYNNGEKEKSEKEDIVVSGTIHNEVKEIYCEVPSVLGDDQETALEKIENRGLVAQLETEYSDTVEKGIVISQSIAGGIKTKSGKTIVVTVSLGIEQVIVPDLLGLSEKKARAKIEEAKLVVGEVSSKYSAKKSGTVISQTIDAEESVDKGTTISFVISKGEKPVEKKPENGSSSNNPSTTNNNNNSNNSNNNNNNKKDDVVDLNPDEIVDLNPDEIVDLN